MDFRQNSKPTVSRCMGYSMREMWHGRHDSVAAQFGIVQFRHPCLKGGRIYLVGIVQFDSHVQVCTPSPEV